MLLLSSSFAKAEIVLHLFDQDTSPVALQTAGACGALSIHHDVMRCNPALLRKTAKNMAVLEITSLVDEPTFAALWKLATVPLTAGDVRDLFMRYSFASYSGYARLATRASWFALEYVPVSLVGAYRISNPSLPLIQAAGEKKSAYSAVASIDSDAFDDTLPFYLSLGMKGKFQQITTAKINVDAISASTLGNKDVVQQRNRNSLNADFGIYLSGRTQWSPKIGAVCVNCFREVGTNTVNDPIRIMNSSVPLSSGHVAWEFQPQLGTLWTSTALFWDGLFEDYRWEKTATSAGYRIGNFSLSLAYSPSRVGWGFLVQRGFYHIGMQYAFEKQPPNLQIERQQKLYMSVGAAL